ncbi:MAG: hypothetical protein NW206_20735 [Hyphomonadaceae bacterium]|nr:hypothetical protein [Hyphomonadaceae bacterium]
MVLIIDPNKNPVGLTLRLQRETDPAARRMLEEVRFHIAIESAGDIDPAVARLAPNSEYIIFDHAGSPTYVRGDKRIREEFYANLFSTREARLEWDIILCAVDGNAVITEGRQKQALFGSHLKSLGFDVDPSGLYLQHSQHLVIWPFDSKLRLIGETVYLGYSQPLEEVARSPISPDQIGYYTGELFELDD